MTENNLNEFKELLTHLINDNLPQEHENIFFNHFRSKFVNGKKESIQKTKLLNVKKASTKIFDAKNCNKLKELFFENDNIKNIDSKNELFNEFIKTYFYKTNKFEFNEEQFEHTFNILTRRIEKNYFEKMFFFTPLYNFDSESAFSLSDNFSVEKISSNQFDKISSLGSEEPISN